MREVALVLLTATVGFAGSLTAGSGREALRSEAALRFAGIVRQQDDHTCGYAAAATALRSLGLVADEASVLKSSGSPVADRGATVADIARAISRWGVESFAVRSTWERLLAYFARFDEPVLGLVSTGRPHFTVILDADAQGVYLADPSLGYLALDPARFNARWTGVLLFLRAANGGGLNDRPIALGLRRARERHRTLLRMQADLRPAQRDFGVGW